MSAEPKIPAWDGPILDPATLDAEPPGTVCIDDVGALRQRRYADTHMGGGWTARGCHPLTSAELTARGTRPVWVLRLGGDA